MEATLKDMTLPDLGIAAGMAVWGFRAAVMGTAGCHVVRWGFEQALAEDGERTLGDLVRLSREIARLGQRRIRIGCPGTSRITADEVSLAALFAAAQEGDRETARAHGTWLMAREMPEEALDLAEAISVGFAVHEMRMRMPQLELGESRFNGALPVLSWVHSEVGLA